MGNANDRENVNDRGWDEDGGGAPLSDMDCRWVTQYCYDQANGGEIPVFLPDPLPIGMCVGEAVGTIIPGILIDTAALSPRAITLHRVTVMLEAGGAYSPPPLVDLTVRLSAALAPGPVLALIEAVSAGGLQKTNGFSFDYDFSPAVVPAANLFGIEILGLGAIGALPVGGSVQIKVAMEWSDCVLAGAAASALRARGLTLLTDNGIALPAAPTRLTPTLFVNEGVTGDIPGKQFTFTQGGIYQTHVGVSITDVTGPPPPPYDNSAMGLVLRAGVAGPGTIISSQLVTVPKRGHAGPGTFHMPVSCGSSWRFAAGESLWAEITGPGHVGATYDVQGFFNVTGTSN